MEAVVPGIAAATFEEQAQSANKNCRCRVHLILIYRPSSSEAQPSVGLVTIRENRFSILNDHLVRRRLMRSEIHHPVRRRWQDRRACWRSVRC
jgi:hypothetical protein